MTTASKTAIRKSERVATRIRKALHVRRDRKQVRASLALVAGRVR